MKIVDLTGDYINLMLRAGDLSAYTRAYPALFRHYTHYWGVDGRPIEILAEEDVLKRSRQMKMCLAKIEMRFAESGYDLRDLEVVLFVGQNTSNGHAFRDRDRFVVWLPIETYHTRSLMEVFFTHEIAHALHYRQSPAFYFKSTAEKDKLSRQLITEGLATYLTMQVLRVTDLKALWADYLSRNQARAWLRECQRQDTELFQFILRHYSTHASKTELFVLSDARDIFKYRAGYYVGLRLVQRLASELQLEPRKLLSLPRDKFESLIRCQLQA